MTESLKGGCAFVDGRYVPLAQAGVPVMDYGFLRSDATYDVVHVWDGAFFRLDDHLDRFERNVAALRMQSPYGRAEMRDILIACVAKSGLRDAYVEMIMTRGVLPLGTRDPRRATNRFTAFAAPFVSYASAEQKSRGFQVVIARSVQRIAPEAVDPTVKNYHWADLTKGLFEAYDRGADTVILTDGSGAVVEGPGFNVFCIENGTVATPDRGGLDGITRRTALEIAAELGIPTRVERVSVERFLNADEAFLTSTAGGILPITRIDERILGNGAPGPVTTRMMDRYMAWHRDGRFATRIDYA